MSLPDSRAELCAAGDALIEERRLLASDELAAPPTSARAGAGAPRGTSRRATAARAA